MNSNPTGKMWGMFYEFKESANGKGWAPKIILWLLSIELNMKAIKLMDNKCIRFMYIYIYKYVYRHAYSIWSIYMIAMILYHKNNTPQHPSTLSFFAGCNSGHHHFWCVFSFQKETTAAGNLLIINQSIGVQWIGHSNQSTWEVPWLSKKKSHHFW